jgi:probable lipoprotein NlpC
MNRTAFLVALICVASSISAETTTVKFMPGSTMQVRAVSTALNYVGTPYLYGGYNGDGVDCSGLVYLVFKDIYPGKLPRTTKELFELGTDAGIKPSAGDLVFFNTDGEGASHVGIYTGDGYFIHSASEGPARGVILSSMAEPYYSERFMGARRLLDWSMPAFEILLGDETATFRHARKLSPQPVCFIISEKAGKVRELEIGISRSNEPYLTRRLVVPAGGQTSLWFWPAAGSYSVTIGQTASIVFQVGE